MSSERVKYPGLQGLFQPKVTIPSSMELCSQAARTYHYDEAQANEHLARPKWQVDGSVLDDAQKAYTGPVFKQVGPTCSAWATIHAAFTIGCRPSPSLVAKLINGGLKDSFFSAEEGGTGLDFFKAAAIVEEADDAGFTYDVPHSVTPAASIMDLASLATSNGKHNYTARQIGEFVSSALDEGSAIVAHIELGKHVANRGHAVCIAGYDSAQSGAMGLQALDSNVGERLITAEQLAKEANRLSSHQPAFAVVTPV